MRSIRLIALLAAASNACANGFTVIDFEAQTTRSAYDPFALDSPLNIGVATFYGGQLVRGYSTLYEQQTGIYPDPTAIYVSATPAPAFFLNPLTILFSVPVNHFSVSVIDYDGFAVNFGVADNLGHSAVKLLDSTGTLGPAEAKFSLPFFGISSVTITELTSEFPFSDYNFAIDNVAFATTPEPALLIPLGAGLFGLAARRALRRKL